MPLAQKLILYALAVALLPLAATGFTLVSLSERALRERIEDHQMAVASGIAGQLGRNIEELAERMQTVLSLVDLQELSVEEREGVGIMLYRQSSAISAVVLLDPQGNRLAPDVYLTERQPIPNELRDHATAVAADAERLRERMPTFGAGALNRARSSQPYFPGDGSARLAVMVPAGRVDGQPIAAVAEVVIGSELQKTAGIEIGEGAQVIVVDSQGRTLRHPSLPAGVPLGALPPVRAFVEGDHHGSLRYVDRRVANLAAFAAVGSLNWAVIVAQPESLAFAVASDMRSRILFWIAATVLVVLASGTWFAGRLRQRLKALIQGARAFGRRELDTAIRVDSGDELAELSTTMNSMAHDLSLSLRELERWNEELEERVEQRSRELQQTQSALLTQSKMAAIGQLGAGVAHEINNPLSGVLGFTQLLLREQPTDAPIRAALEQIEVAARRCRDITNKLLRYSERSRDDTANRFEINQIIEETLELTSAAMERITVEHQLDPDAGSVLGSPGEMSVVLINLLTNARNAMREGGRIRVETKNRGTTVRLLVQDSGSGIAEEDLPRIFDPFFTRKSHWTAVGLGLSLVYRIVDDMGGKVEVESTSPGGTTMRIDVPRVKPES